MIEFLNYPRYLSLVIPLYNESERLSEQFNFLKKLLENHINWEIIFINDGSSDKTFELLQAKTKDIKRMKVISYNENQGKGYAIKMGVKAAISELILFSDVDFSTPITELPLFMPFIKNNADIIIGTRKVQGATINRHQSYIREWLGRRFTNLSNTILGLDISDFTCGFKLFKKDIAKKVFLKSKIKRWGFDSEILYLANKYNYKIVEVPVIWENDRRTKVNLAKDIIRSFSDLIKIRWYDAVGRYEK